MNSSDFSNFLLAVKLLGKWNRMWHYRRSHSTREALSQAGVTFTVQMLEALQGGLGVWPQLHSPRG